MFTTENPAPVPLRASDSERRDGISTSEHAPGQPPTGEAVFRVRGVSKVYQMGEVAVYALRSVDLDLFTGELAVILGASGSGKSTLLNIIGGLDVPTTGEVIYRDHNLTSATDREPTVYRRDHVGFVFQFYNLIPSLTALENSETNKRDHREDNLTVMYLNYIVLKMLFIDRQPQPRNFPRNKIWS